MPPPPPRPPGRIGLSPAAVPDQQRRTGLVALSAAFLVLALVTGGARAVLTPAASEPKATPVPTGYTPDPPVPTEARTSLYRSQQAASGAFAPATLKLRAASRATTVNPFTVQVETSLRTDPDAVARTIHALLDDERGWASYGKNSFDLVPTDAPGQLTFLLASPPTVDALCGADVTKGSWDCRKDRTIVLNSDRWFFGAPTYPEVADYRAFMVNRQVGFLLGQGNATCKKKGAKAPVMMDQGKTLDGCLPNPWPTTAG